MELLFSLVWASLALTATPVSVAQEQARLADGTVVSGHLAPDGAGGYVFIRAEPVEPIPLSAISQVIRQPAAAPARRRPPPFHLSLWGDEAISGTVQAIADGNLALVTSTGQQLNLPLYLVSAVAHYQGEAVVLEDDYEQPSRRLRQCRGASRSSQRAATGRWSLQFARPPDSVQYVLPRPVGSGRLQLWFYDHSQQPAGLEWVCELEFTARQRTRTAQVLLTSEAESYGLVTPQGPSLGVQHVARQRGWHQLQLVFTPDHTLLLIDNAVLANAPVWLGALAAVTIKLTQRQPPAQPPPNGRPTDQPIGYVDLLRVAETVGQGDWWQPAADQDDVRLIGGDQLYGTVVAADASRLTLQTSFGQHQVPWREVAEVRLAPRPCPTKKLAGWRVQLLFCPHQATEADPRACDTLVGCLRSLTEAQIVLEHPHIGPVSVPRQQLRQVRFLSKGTWLVIDAGFHHFGDNVHLSFQLPYAEGARRSWQFELDQVPERAVLELHALELESMKPGARWFQQMQAGHLRTYLSLNGQELEPEGINRRVPLGSRGPVRLRIPVPPGLLVQGRNLLQLHQSAQQEDATSFDDCGIYRIGLLMNSAQ